jgi:hypothetical protein
VGTGDWSKYPTLDAMHASASVDAAAAESGFGSKKDIDPMSGRSRRAMSGRTDSK